MKNQRSRPNRRSIRLKGFDYRAARAYFVTICSSRGRPCFGIVQDQEMILNPLGTIIDAYWREIPSHYPNVRLDEHIVMPNHVHVLFWLDDDHEDSSNRTDTNYRVRAPLPRDPPDRAFGGSIPDSVSTIIGGLKAAVTRTARRKGLIPSGALWQGRFWDRIVRDEEELQKIRDYIRNNPARWLMDQLHPDAPPNQFNRW